MACEKSWKIAVTQRYPGLLSRIERIIRDSEREYLRSEEGRGIEGKIPDSFLWEHSIQVAALAFRIASREEDDPLPVILAALLHDAGKFQDGRYHENDKPEETTSAKLARRVLSEAGFGEAQVEEVAAGLTALYTEEDSANKIADRVHDADFLAKSGYLGVAVFFLKSALRGYSLQTTILQELSKELTYISVLPENMRTSAGQNLARLKKKAALAYYKGLLGELADDGIALFEINEVRLPCPNNPHRDLDIILVQPESCQNCGGTLFPVFSSEYGIKCRKLIAEIECGDCSRTYRIAFCLPEILC